MASSRKPGPSKSKSTRNKKPAAKIEDAVVVNETSAAETSSADPKQSAAPKAPDSAVDIAKPTDKAAVPPKAQDTPKPAEKAAVEKEKPVAEKPEVKPTPAPVVKPVPEEKKNSFLPLVLGGIVAGVIGYVISQFGMSDTDDAAITTQLRTDLTMQQERLTALEAVEPVEVPAVDFTPVEAQLSALDDRITALENRPAIVLPEGDDGAATEAAVASIAAAYAAELEDLRTSAQAQRAEIEALLADAKSVNDAAAAAATSASGLTAIAKIVSSIDAGQPFPDAFADLQDLELDGIDAALGDVAADGVLTLTALQADFSEQARSALAAARASDVGEGQQGLGSFLQRSLGARSVVPRDGNDRDAVLSRAEAAVQAGDLNTALTELDTLPEEAQAAIAEWRAGANARVSARAAADALAQRLTAD